MRLLCSLAMLCLSGVAGAAGSSTDALDRLLAGRAAGAPTLCVDLPDINERQVAGGAVVYRIGDTLWVNKPSEGASRLREDDLLASRTVGSRLCEGDLLYRINRNSGLPLGFVRLGEFVPYRRPSRR